DSAGKRCASKGSSVRSGAKQVGVRRAHPESPNRDAAAQGFRHGNGVRQKTCTARNILQNPLVALKPASPKMAALDFIHHEQKLFLIAEPPQPQKIFGAGGSNATAFALKSFDQNSGRCRRNSAAHSFQIPKRQTAK